MCGIVGACTASVFTASELKYIQRLVILSHFRGSHSTGWFSHSRVPSKDKTSPFKYYKSLEHPIHFAYNKFSDLVEKDWKEGIPSTLSFHTRFATKGEVSKVNAHPFNTKRYLGMHNGTIHSGLKLEKEFETDSEALYNQMSEQGAAETLKDIGYNGAYALVFLDKTEKTLNFARNAQRPLHIVKKSGVLYWASEGRDLQNALDIQGSILLASDVEGKLNVTEGVVYQLPVGQIISKNLKTNELDLTTTEIPVKTYQGNSYYGGTSNNFDFFRNRDREEIPWKSRTNGSAVGVSSRTNWKVDGPVTRLNNKAKNSSNNTIFLNVGLQFSKEANFNLWGDYIKGNDPKEPSEYLAVWSLELDGWVATDTYQSLCVLRALQPKEFQVKASDVFFTKSRSDRSSIAEAMGVSVNFIKKMLKGGRALMEYVLKPEYYRPASRSYVRLSYFPDIDLKAQGTMLEARRARIVREGVMTVVTHPAEEGIQEEPTEEAYFYGKDQRSCSKEEFIRRTSLGCANDCGCVDLIGQDLFWIDDDSFLCEDCQEDIIRPSNTNFVFTTYKHRVRQHVAERMVREDRDTRSAGSSALVVVH